MNLAELNKIAEAMVAPGKGILAADESSGTIKKRFDAIGVESTEDNRRDYREMLFRSPTRCRNTFPASSSTTRRSGRRPRTARRWSRSSSKTGAIPGIKVDKGTKPLPFCPGELITDGLDSSRDRLPKYYEHGARFAKWRAVIDIGDGIPSYACDPAPTRTRSRATRRSARTAQIVPIVEPEVLMDGDHDIDRCVRGHRVRAEGNRSSSSIISASRSKASCSSRTWSSPARRARRRRPCEEVAEKTVRMLKNCVPGAVPGIAFLSGGQSDEEATAHLDAMNKIGSLPWKLTFSYGRALQAAPQKAWSGKSENVAAAPARLHAPRADERPCRARPMEGRPGKEGGIIFSFRAAEGAKLPPDCGRMRKPCLASQSRSPSVSCPASTSSPP